MSATPDYLTTKEAANYLRKSVFTIRRMIESGVFTVAKFGREYRIERESFAAYLKRHTRPARRGCA